MFGWKYLRDRLRGRHSKHEEKIASLIQRRDALKESVRQLSVELDSRRFEVETLRAGIAGLAHAHGRLLKNYNDQVQHNKTLERRLAAVEGQPGATPVEEPSRPLLNGRPLDLGAFPVLSRSAATTEKFISTRYGFIFVIVPKVASRSLLEALWQLHEGGKGAFIFEDSPRELFRLHPYVWNYTKLAVVRDPFRRAVSCYIDKVLDGDPVKTRLFEKSGLETPPASFEEFVQFLASPKGRDEVSDRHWVSQAALLGDTQGRLWIDRFARHERLEEELGQILGQFGLTLPPLRRVNDRREHLQVGTAERQALTDGFYRTPAIEACLRERYAADIALFGYGAELGEKGKG